MDGSIDRLTDRPTDRNQYQGLKPTFTLTCDKITRRTEVISDLIWYCTQFAYTSEVMSHILSYLLASDKILFKAEENTEVGSEVKPNVNSSV